jgi:hypothetical protein
MNTREEACATCGSVYVFTRKRGYDWRRGGALVSCSVCHAFLPIGFERGRWAKRLIRRGSMATTHETCGVRLIALLATLLACFFTYLLAAAAKPPEGAAEGVVLYAIAIAFAAGVWLLALAAWCSYLRLARRPGTPCS